MKILNKKAFSVIEYTVLFIIVIGAFLIMRNYIQRGVFGMWGQAGQSFAFGRQYDPQKTVDCAFDQRSHRWYDRNCFDYLEKAKGCNGSIDCEERIITDNSSCPGSSCYQLNNGESP